MKSTALLLGVCAVFAAPAGPASAEPCSAEIEALTKTLASTDAGAGPTAPGSAQTGGSSENVGTSGEHPPTGRVGTALGGSAASPEDVRRQTSGQPTASEQARGRRSTATADKAAASASLERARTFEKQGREADCMAAISDAKRQLSGP